MLVLTTASTQMLVFNTASTHMSVFTTASTHTCQYLLLLVLTHVGINYC